jgi:hypothetical protein
MPVIIFSLLSKLVFDCIKCCIINFRDFYVKRGAALRYYFTTINSVCVYRNSKGSPTPQFDERILLQAWLVSPYPLCAQIHIYFIHSDHAEGPSKSGSLYKHRNV